MKKYNTRSVAFSFCTPLIPNSQECYQVRSNRSLVSFHGTVISRSCHFSRLLSKTSQFAKERSFHNHINIHCKQVPSDSSQSCNSDDDNDDAQANSESYNHRGHRFVSMESIDSENLDVKDQLHVIEVSLPQGNEILFPGSTLMIRLTDQHSLAVLRAVLDEAEQKNFEKQQGHLQAPNVPQQETINNNDYSDTEAAAVAANVTQNIRNPPRFGLATINAWGEMGQIGTVARIIDVKFINVGNVKGSTHVHRFDPQSQQQFFEEQQQAGLNQKHMQHESQTDPDAPVTEFAVINCLGEARFYFEDPRPYLIGLSQLRTRVKQQQLEKSEDFKINDKINVLVFHDIPEEDQTNANFLEEKLIYSISEVVRLSMKLLENDEQGKGKLNQTMERIKAFQNASKNIIRDSDPSLHQFTSYFSVSPAKRRELLGFVVCDILDLPYYERKSILDGRNTSERLEAAIEFLQEPLLELGAKSALFNAIG